MKKENLFDIHHINPIAVRKSSAWFDDKIKNIARSSLRPANLMQTESGKITSVMRPGHMYMYLYDPIGKETLPYYDTFPLVLPFSRTKTHFTGLNLHYLDYPIRFMLLKELMKVGGVTNLNENSRIKLEWDMIRSVAKLAPAKACVKQYLFSQIKSPLFQINSTEWHTAALLPFQRFVGGSAKSIWRDSVRKF
jgi:hypothetical protein